MAATIFMCIKLKSTILKIIIFGLAISATSILYHTDVPGIVSDPWFQLLITGFGCCLLTTAAFRNCDGDDDKEALYALVCCALLILATSAFLIANIVRCGPDNNFFWWAGLVIYLVFSVVFWVAALENWSDGDPDPHRAMAVIHAICVVLVASILIFNATGNNAKKFIVLKKPAQTVQSLQSSSEIEKFLAEKNGTKEFMVKTGTIFFPNDESFPLDGYQISVTKKGGVVTIITDHAYDPMSSLLQTDNRQAVIETSGGKLIIPANAEIRFGITWDHVQITYKL
jgi:hypothetical protein